MGTLAGMVPQPSFTVVFYRSDAGREPVREWLRSLPADVRQAIGEDLMVVQFRWPLGMPLVRKMEPDLWELRSSIPTGIARVFFTVWQIRIVALHGFIKKSQATPARDLATAKRRLVAFSRSTP
jgi:phage-related protein